MEPYRNSSGGLFRRPLLHKAMLGAGVAFLLILVFIAGVETQPEWPEMWQIRPLTITTISGAFGGVIFHLLIQLLPKTGIPKLIVYILSLLFFVVILWLGIVLGLDGTLWN
ncbi:potassium transporter KefB [Psychroflexus sp. CAK57W]|uniref:potassium transporter KefB n=1 Tax=Psychroflexus curvus TaxID=2873595 RepID=UPI001CCE16A9|nr:potassium transporter KefB [Psychroflexus curvus]MBZ9787628.1 potassium transporter KefB [Psychroflexus curvus]